MHYYQNVLPWVKLILNCQNPFTQKDADFGISFLLPMEELFEKYVADILKRQLGDCELKTQDKRYYLAKQNDKGVFQLRPDMVIFKNKKPVCVLDTKWQ